MLALVDRSLIGNLYQFMADFEGELDEIATDIVIEGRDVVWPWEEHRVANQWAAHFENELEAHRTKQAKARRPVLDENFSRWTYVGRPNARCDLEVSPLANLFAITRYQDREKDIEIKCLQVPSGT